MDIGNNLRRLRVAKKIKAIDIADLLGVSATTYNRIETNQSDLNANLVPKIAEYFDTTIGDIYGVDDKLTLTNPTQHIKDSATGIVMVQHNNPTKEQPLLLTNEQNPLERIITALEKTVAAQSATITAQQTQIETLLEEVGRLRGL
jgi:transcriptional regulator with XRE-family HTH domain